MKTKTTAFAVLAACGFGLWTPFGAKGGTPSGAADNAQPYRWTNVKIIAGGFISGLVFSPAQKGLIYARTDIGGAYRWDSGHRRWIPLTDWAGGKDANLLGCESIGVDPTDASRVYLALGTYKKAGNGAIVRSRDQGRTWQRADLPVAMGGNEDGRSAGERLAVDPNDPDILYFGSRHNGLWRSGDRGRTWSNVAGFPIHGETNGIGVVFVLFDRRSGAYGHATPVLYAGVSQNGPSLYRSLDAGLTWQTVPGQPGGLLPHQGALAATGDLYLTYGNKPGPNGMSDGAVWKYGARSGVWTDITPVAPNAGGEKGFGYAGLTVDMQHPETVMVSTMDRWDPGDDLFRSRDAGAHWSSIKLKAQLDSSLTPWVNFGAPKPRFGWWIGALALDPFAAGHVLYGTGATIWGTDDVTASDAGLPTHWSVRAQGVEETAVICLISPTAGAHLISGLGDIGGFRHDDLNVSPKDGMWARPEISNTDSLDFAAENPAFMVKVGRGKPGLNGAYSRDGGATWAPFPGEPPGSQGSGTVAVSADGASIVWLPGRGAASYSRDNGQTWLPCAGLDSGRYSVVSDRVDSNRFYALGGHFLWISKDGGATFTAGADLSAMQSEKARLTLHAAPGRTGDLWLTAMTKGLYRSTDGGATFTPVGNLNDAEGFGFGKAAPGQDYPALYLTNLTADGESGVFRSDDAGKNWLRINDHAHQYGWPGQQITGDPRIYGRAYWGSNGRGIFYGDPATSGR